MKNLIVGKTSQLSKYYQAHFDNCEVEYTVVSAKDIDANKSLISNKWNEVYLCFGESRKNINDSCLYFQVNYDLTLSYVNLLLNHAQSIYVYSTCELWNEYNGPITLSEKWKHSNSQYVISKRRLTEIILADPTKYSNVHVQYPFNFNSPFRTKDFLFGKVFASILNKERIEIGNIHFYRDIIHPNFVVKQTIGSKRHQLIGSGRMVYVFDFIKDLYSLSDLDFGSLIHINNQQEHKTVNEYYMYSKNCMYHYNDLLNDTIMDLKKYKNGEL